jgi:MSHA biogenesis protein MshE
MSAIATVNRLLDMGAAGYMIAAAVHGIVAQRLVRRICDNCSHATEADPNQLAWLSAQVGPALATQMKFHAGTGCTYCNLTGYRGRVAVYELLELDRVLADFVRRGDAIGFAEAARNRNSFKPLAMSALELASRGVTTLEEAISVTSGLDDEEEIAPLTPLSEAMEMEVA